MTGMHPSGFRVVVTDQVFPDLDVEREVLGAAGGVVEVAGDDVLAAIRWADAVLNTYFPLDAASIATLQRCRIIARYGIGVDNVDLTAAKRAGIAVTNVPDYCVEEVAAHTTALLLALLRRLPQGDAAVRAGRWGVGEVGEIHRLSTLTVGLLGYGRIARRVAHIVAALGANVIAHDPYVSTEGSVPARMVGLTELLGTSDVVCVHCPLTPQTRGLIDARALAAMKPGAFLVNTSRGLIVVLDDVLAALGSGHLGGAGLDVFDTEPPDAQRLTGVPNLVLTPHAAFYSEEAIAESQRKAAQQVVKAIRGEPLDYRVA
jgi:D-3-phosphoglycerate dehydrogenase